MANDTLNALMHISLNGPSTKEAKEIINQSVDVWLNKKKRRKLQPQTYGKSPILERPTVVRDDSESDTEDQVALATEKMGLDNDVSESDRDADSDYDSDSDCYI